jgi:hypothetical protein
VGIGCRYHLDQIGNIDLHRAAFVAARRADPAHFRLERIKHVRNCQRTGGDPIPGEAVLLDLETLRQRQLVCGDLRWKSFGWRQGRPACFCRSGIAHFGVAHIARWFAFDYGAGDDVEVLIVECGRQPSLDMAVKQKRIWMLIVYGPAGCFCVKRYFRQVARW